MEVVEKDNELTVPRGKPKSGRVWKRLKTNRFSDMTRVKSQKTSWEEKMQLKKEKQTARELQQSLKDEKKAKQEALRKRRELNAKRKLENERKGEIVQTIKNTSKIRKMKKATLRKIEKR